MIAKVEFGYDARQIQATKSEDPEFYSRVRQIIGKGTPEGDEHIKNYYEWPGEGIFNLEEINALTELGVPVTLHKVKGMQLAGTILEATATHRNIVNIQVPHIGLLAIEEVELLEDCCTDFLQQRLDEGWRILCVCPPNAQRRPDYIMGRSKEKQ